jgi:hypothetical protein
VDQFEYRAKLRTMSTVEIVDELGRVREDIASRPARTWGNAKGLTDHWQARQLLAELGSRQMQMDYGELSR